jgi:hypothetical protein
MNYEFQIEADSVDELTNTLMAIVAALKMAQFPGTIRFARYPSANDDFRGQPLQPVEPHVAQALADAVIAAEETEPAPVRRRRRRSVNGSGGDEDTPSAAPASALVQNPDGNVVAVTQEMARVSVVDPAPAREASPAATSAANVTTLSTELPEGMRPPPEDTGADMAPNDMRERAINLMQQAFGYAAGPDLVRAVHRRLKVRKISDVPDAQCRELLDDATAILAQLKASGEPLDLLAMAGKK